MNQIILKNLEGEDYHQLLDLAFDVCDCFYFVVRKETLGFDIENYEEELLEDKGLELIDELEPYLIEIKEQTEWPLTTLLSAFPASIYYYKAGLESKKIMKKLSHSNKEWMQPQLPEDLGFLKNNEVWFASCTHEGDFVVITDSLNEKDRLKQIENIEPRER